MYIGYALLQFLEPDQHMLVPSHFSTEEVNILYQYNIVVSSLGMLLCTSPEQGMPVLNVMNNCMICLSLIRFLKSLILDDVYADYKMKYEPFYQLIID